jgi:hypothetical protein
LVEVPVVPICIRFQNPELCWVDDQTFVPHYLATLRKKPHVVQLDFGLPLPAEDYSSDEEHAEAARSWIAERLTS